MSSIRDKLGLVKTEIPIDEIPSHTQEISDWLRLRYLNETNQNSYVLTAFDWIEESVPQKYKLQQINTNVDISSNVEKEIIWDNISEFVERKNVKEVVGLPNEEYSKNLTSNFHKTFQDVIGDVQYSQIEVNPWPEKIPDLDSKDKLFIDATIPGLTKDQLSIEVKNGVLSINGSSANSPDEKNLYLLISIIIITQLLSKTFMVNQNG